ncbi:MAG TPA: hypothetical protein IAC04_04345 [Candidatus Coprenecus stercoravium]|uniref:BACON domain-containing protein n=1 Tax=Candidatus Coprenecus stercoravium TaxID=2840735 RepID=A0A9D2KA91_9BACT|nr:hypothetical protein [Candidatus Coprenecus stercoravium]
MTVLAFGMMSGCKSGNGPDTPQNAPRINLGVQGNITVDAKGGEAKIPYTIVNPAKGGEVKASSSQDWVSVTSYTDSTIILDVETYTEEENRNSIITIEYSYDGGNATPVQANLVQRGARTYDHELTAEVFTGTYEEINGHHCFTVNLSNLGYDADGYGKPEGMYYSIIFFSEEPADLENPLPAVGKYEVSDNAGDSTVMVISPASSVLSYDENGDRDLDAALDFGTMDISREGNVFTFDAELEDDNGETHHVIYSGEIELNVIYNGMQVITSDVDLKATQVTPQYMTDDYGVMQVYLHMTDMKINNGKYEAPGSLLRVHTFMPYDRNGNIAAGHYVVEETLRENSILAGYLSGETPYGTFVDVVDEMENEFFGLVTSGTMEVEKSGSTYNITCNFTTSDDYTVTASFNGSLEDMIDKPEPFSTFEGNRILALSEPFKQTEAVCYGSDFYLTGDAGSRWVITIRSGFSQVEDGVALDIVSSGTFESGIATGTYTPAVGFPRTGEYLPGSMVEGGIYGSNYIGAFLNGMPSKYAPAVSGNLDITNKGNDNYDIKFSFVDDLGYTWEGEYSGKLTVSEGK